MTPAAAPKTRPFLRVLRRRWALICVAAVVIYSCLAQRTACSSQPLRGTDHYGWTMRLAQQQLPWRIRGWNPGEWNGASFFYFYGFLPHLTAAVLIRVLNFLDPVLVFNLVIVAAGALLPVTTFVWARREFGPAAGVLAAVMVLGIVHDPGTIGVTWGWGAWPNAFGLMLFPLAMYAYTRFRQDPSGRSAVLLGLLPSGPLFGHVFVGVVSWLVLCVQAAVGWLTAPGRRRLAGRVWLILIPAILLSAFWWGPMFVKHGYVRTTSGGWMAPWFAFMSPEKSAAPLNGVMPGSGGAVVWGFVIAGLLFAAWRRRFDLLAGTGLALLLATGAIYDAARSLGVLELPGVFLLRAYWRAYAPAKIMAFVTIAGLLGALWQAGGWRRGIGAALTVCLAAVWIGPQYKSYWERARGIGRVSPEWRTAITQVRRIVAGKGRVCLDHTADQADGLWAAHALTAAEVPIITGFVGELTLCPEWTDLMTHNRLDAGAMFERARLCAVSHIVAVGRGFRSKLDAFPGRFERIARAGPATVYRVRAPLRWAVATARKPVLVFASLERWQQIVRPEATGRDCRFIVRCDRAPDDFPADKMRQFGAVILDRFSYPSGVSERLRRMKGFSEAARGAGKAASAMRIWNDPRVPTVPLETGLDAPCERVGPGHMVIKVPRGATGVFIKESFFPNFRAKLEGKGVPIYMAAPNMMYVPVEGPGRLEVRFVTDRVDWVFLGVSVAALAALLLVARRFAARNRPPA